MNPIVRETVSGKVDVRSARTERAPRNVRIEALRLFAVASIAIFHTFQDWFSLAAAGSEPVLYADACAMTALGCIDLLGAYANHVFYLISGLFLVPRAAVSVKQHGKEKAHGKSEAVAKWSGYWSEQMHASAKRLLPLIGTVVLYAVAAHFINAFVVPIGEISLLGGLEFIWVYAILVVLTPLFGWAWARCAHPCRLVAILVVFVYALNAYVAFVAPGNTERSLLEWRKLLSAATYLVTYLVGAALACRTPRYNSAKRILMALVLVCAAVEAFLAMTGRYGLMEAVSYKSTSFLSFALAVSSLEFARVKKEEKGDALLRRVAVCESTPRVHGVVTRLAASTLGYYVLQSFFRPLLIPPLAGLLANILADVGAGAFIVVGAVASLGFAVMLIVVDQIVRLCLLRKLVSMIARCIRKAR